MAKRTKWDRDGRGRFAATDIAGSKRTPLARVPRTELSMAEQTRNIHIPRAEGRKRIDLWTVGFSSETEGTARIHERFGRGRLGPAEPHPRGGTHRPLLEAAGFKVRGVRQHTPEESTAWKASQRALKEWRLKRS